MILKTWIEKPRGMLLVEEDSKNMVAWGSKSEGELVEASQSEDHRKVEAVVKK